MSAHCPPWPAGPRGRRRQRRAEERGRRKARLIREVVELVAVVAILGLFLRPVAWIVGIVWGYRLTRRFAQQWVEPGLREHWVEREVGREFRRHVPARRRALADDHARRLEELSASIAHEIRSPVAAAKGLVQQMGEDPASRSNVGYAGVALEELDRVERSISHLLHFAREEEVRTDEIWIGELIDATLESLQETLQRAGILVETRLDPTGPLRADPEQLRRVLMNLLGNAVDALREARTPQPRILIEAGENLAGTEIWLRVQDNGPGIEADRVDRVFRPFHTSKASGSGLGLSIAKKLVDAHGGSIEVHSEPDAGTELLVTLPRPHGAAEA